MSEKQNSQIEEFSKLLSESSPEDVFDKDNIYSRLRNTFSPREIVELLIEYTEQRGLPEEEVGRKTFEDIYTKAEKEIPFDEAHSRDLLIKELAPFYDKVGDIALHLSVAFATIEMAGFLLRRIDFASEFASQIKSLIFDHVGNSQNSFWIIPVFAAIKLGEKALSEKEISIPDVLILKKVIETLVDIGKILLPYIMITVMLGYQIDAETAQILPGSFGTPDITDVPVGLISIIGLAKVLEMQRYHRPFFRPLPLIDKLSKAQSNIKAVLPLFVASHLNAFVIPNQARKWMSSTALQEEEPISNSPVSFVRSAFQRIFRGE